MADELTRSIKIPISDGLSLDMELPNVTNRASKYLVFDGSGLPSVSSGTGTDTSLRTDLSNTSVALAGASLVGFRASDANSTARTVLAKLRDTVSVKDFGAVGDGVADDTAAIQAAINTNKEVFVPNGTYNLSASLTMTNSQQIRGESQTLAILKTIAAVNAITVADSSSCKISNLYINGNNIGLIGIKVGLGITFSAFHTIEFCYIYNFTSYGIHLNGTSYVWVDSCFIRNNGGNGIYNNLGSPSGYGNANTISNCQIWDCGTYGIHLYRASNNIIENTKFVLATGGTSLTVGNRISNIYINNSHSTTIDKCEFENVDSGYTTYNILIDDLDSPAALPNTVGHKIRGCRFVGYLLNCSYNIALGLIGNVYNTEIASTTFVRAVNEDVYLGQYANNTVIDDCEHRFTYDTPLLGENATVYNPYSMLYTLFEFGNQSRGTFTPIFQTTTGGTNWSSTYSSNTGYYTKIQNVVHFSLGINVNVISASGAGALIITGLPFPCWDNGVPTSLAISGLLNLTTPATYNVNVRARLKRSTYVDRSITNGTVIELFYGASNDIALPSAQLNNGHYMILSGSYFTSVI
jgi:parallel beta-helix repeat protein